MSIEATGNKDNYYLEIDIEKDMGIDFPLAEDAKREIGLAIIEKIIERTRNKKQSLNGGSFTNYSEAYAKKKGVNVTDVNLTLFGDMLNSLSITQIIGNKIKIESDDRFQTPKIFNHDTGDTLPKRQFFGVLNSELNEIKRNKIKIIENSSGADKELKKQNSLVDAIAKSIIIGLRFD